MSQEEYARYDPLITYLMVSVPDFFHSYLDATKSIGEFAARQRVVAEIRQLIQEQPELACMSVPEEYKIAESE